MINFPTYTGLRCLMMPYIQGDPTTVPDEYGAYEDVIATSFIDEGALGFLTIDESPVTAGTPHRGNRAKFGRALHTEAGIIGGVYCWGSPYGWGGSRRVTLERDVKIILASNLTNSCAVWDAEHTDTSEDGDIGDHADLYPYATGDFMQAGEERIIGILTPHESLPVTETAERQFLRIVGEGVHGREDHFTINPLMPKEALQ